MKSISRLSNVVILFFVLIVECLSQDKLQEKIYYPLVNSEREFCNLAIEKGIKESFLFYSSKEAIVFQPKPASAKKTYEQRKSSSTYLLWEPEYAEMSISGDFGYTAGPWLAKKDKDDTASLGFGHYVTIWKKQKNGLWKWVIDIGISHENMPVIRLEEIPTYHEPGDNKMSKAKLKNNSQNRNLLIETDKSFSKISRSKGYLSAFEWKADNNIRLFRDGFFPIVGKKNATEFIKLYNSDYRFTPIYFEISNGADLGYTYGISEQEKMNNKIRQIDSSSYVRVWRSSNNQWKIVLDIEVPINQKKSN